MKPENQAVMDGIAAEVRSLTIAQRRVFLRAMKNPYFRLLAFCMADADERQSRMIHMFVSSVTGRRNTTA